MDRAAKKALRGIVDSLFWAAVGALCAAIAFVLFFKFSPYNLVNVHGPSMETTLTDGDLIIIKNSKDISRDQVALFEPSAEWELQINNNGAKLIKRVKGLPGDSIVYKGNYVEVTSTSGEVTKVVNSDVENCMLDEGEQLTLESGDYFLIGDNREQSFDSLAAWCQGFNPAISEDRISVSGDVTFRLKSFGGSNG